MERKTYDELKGMIKDGDVVAFTTFGPAGLPMEIMANLVKEYQETKHPKDLTLISSNNLSDYLSKAGFDEFVEAVWLNRLFQISFLPLQSHNRRLMTIKSKHIYCPKVRLQRITAMPWITHLA